MPRIIHITSPDRALNIINLGCYLTKNNPGHYDAGMNFLGVLGEYPNTQPTRGAKIHCEWNGAVSAPLEYDSYNYHDPNVLFDFNGSGNHFPNNDPRYFLPYGSDGVIVRRIELEDDYNQEEFIKQWSKIKGGLFLFLCRFEIFHNFLLKKALKNLQDVNQRLATNRVTIAVAYG
jgi:hypothetical protein